MELCGREEALEIDGTGLNSFLAFRLQKRLIDPDWPTKMLAHHVPLDAILALDLHPKDLISVCCGCEYTSTQPAANKEQVGEIQN